MPKKTKPPHDDASSAPESGTVRDDTSGNQPSDRNNDPRHHGRNGDGGDAQVDDPSVAGEEP